MYSDTSAAGFAAVQKSLGRRQQEILRVFRASGAWSNRQISSITGIPINAVTPRVLELRQAGKLVHAGYTVDTLSGITVKTWKVPA